MVTKSGNVQLVIPMAGLGTRFSESGYVVAKPLLPIHGQPMFLVVLANLLSDDVGTIHIIAQKAIKLNGMGEFLREKTNRDVNLIEIDYVTGGPADTVDLARPFLIPDLPVVTANSDQYVDSSLDQIYKDVADDRFGGCILTMEDSDPKWSYVLKDNSGFVSKVKEKEVISNLATAGIYGFNSADLMLESFDSMRANNDMVNGEYYVAPSYNYLVKAGHKIVTRDLGAIASVMHGMGIPDDYEAFLKNPVSEIAASRARSLFGN